MADMNRAYQKILDGIKLADEGRDEIMAGLQAAITAGTDLDTQLRDLRDTVAQMQALIMEQGVELKALRARLNGGH